MTRDILVTIEAPDDLRRMPVKGDRTGKRFGPIREDISKEKRAKYREIVTGLLEDLGIPYKTVKADKYATGVDSAQIVAVDKNEGNWNRYLRLELFAGVSNRTLTPAQYWVTPGSWCSDYAYQSGKPIKGELYGKSVEYDSLDVLGRLFVRLAGSDWFASDTVNMSYEGRETEFTIFARYGIIVVHNYGIHNKVFPAADTVDEEKVIAYIRRLDIPKKERDKL